MENLAVLNEGLSSNQCKCDCHLQVEFLLQNALKDRKEIRELELKLAKLEGLADKINDKDQVIAIMQYSIELNKNNIESSLKLMDDLLLEYKDKLSKHQAIIIEKEDQLDKLQAVIKEKDYLINKKKELELEATITNLEYRNKAVEAYPQEKYDQLVACSPLIGDKPKILKMISIPDYDAFTAALARPGSMVMQRRLNGSVKFETKSLGKYIVGFGDPDGEFWLGLKKMHLITSSGRYELYIQLVDINNQTHYAHYDHFSVGNFSERYYLKSLGKYSGSATDAMRCHEKGEFRSGWWRKVKTACNLNGRYQNQGINDPSGIKWAHFGFLNSVQMLIKRKAD